MKKLLTLTFLILASISASATSLTWTAAATAFEGVRFNQDTSLTLTGYLIYLGKAGSAYQESYTFDHTATADSVTASVGTKVDSMVGANKLAKMTGNWQYYVADYPNNDAVFGLVLEYVNGDDTYYNLANQTITLVNGSDAPPMKPNDLNFTFVYTTSTEDGVLRSGGGWTKVPAVPEPATAGLALLGVALMIKRRRA